MKFIWEEKDIKAGRKYSRPDIKETWSIGYQDGNTDGRRWVSISQSDGLVTLPSNTQEMAEKLTNGKYIPLEFMLPRL